MMDSSHIEEINETGCFEQVWRDCFLDTGGKGNHLQVEVIR